MFSGVIGTRSPAADQDVISLFHQDRQQFAPMDINTDPAQTQLNLILRQEEIQRCSHSCAVQYRTGSSQYSRKEGRSPDTVSVSATATATATAAAAATTTATRPTTG